MASQNDSDMYVVAHQDDALLFMNPRISASIESGNTVWAVYLTAGDAGRTGTQDCYEGNTSNAAQIECWKCREAGMEGAYAAMAGLSNSWTTTALSLSGTPVLTANSTVKNPTLFLRLPDGKNNGAGNSSTSLQTLRKVWEGSNGTEWKLEQLHHPDQLCCDRRLRRLDVGAVSPGRNARNLWSNQQQERLHDGPRRVQRKWHRCGDRVLRVQLAPAMDGG